MSAGAPATWIGLTRLSACGQLGRDVLLPGGCPARPVAVAGLAENRISAGQQGSLAKLGSPVARVRVCDHHTRIAAHGQDVPEELVHPELLGPGDLDDTVQR